MDMSLHRLHVELFPIVVEIIEGFDFGMSVAILETSRGTIGGICCSKPERVGWQVSRHCNADIYRERFA